MFAATSVFWVNQWLPILAILSVGAYAKLELAGLFGESTAYVALFTFTASEYGLFTQLCILLCVYAVMGRSIVLGVVLLTLCLGDFKLATLSGTGLRYIVAPTAGLLNGLLFIHPPILFSGFALCSIVFYITFMQIEKVFAAVSWTKLLRWGLQITSFAVFLGSLWAQHELNWGGWWGWDLVELGSLIPVIFFLTFAHKPFGFSLVSRQHKFFFFFFFFFYFGLRFGFFASVHSFAGGAIGNFKSGADLYVLLFFFMFLPRLVYNNIFFSLSSIILLFIGLCLIGDFISGYWLHLPQFNSSLLLCLIFIIFFCVLGGLFPLTVFCGWAPSFLLFISLNWLSEIKIKKQLHFLIICFFISAVLLKFGNMGFNISNLNIHSGLIISSTTITQTMTSQLFFNPLAQGSLIGSELLLGLDWWGRNLSQTLGGVTPSTHLCIIINLTSILMLQSPILFFTVPSLFLIFFFLIKK